MKKKIEVSMLGLLVFLTGCADSSKAPVVWETDEMESSQESIVAEETEATEETKEKLSDVITGIFENEYGNAYSQDIYTKVSTDYEKEVFDVVMKQYEETEMYQNGLRTQEESGEKISKPSVMIYAYDYKMAGEKYAQKFADETEETVQETNLQQSPKAEQTSETQETKKEELLTEEIQDAEETSLEDVPLEAFAVVGFLDEEWLEFSDAALYYVDEDLNAAFVRNVDWGSTENVICELKNRPYFFLNEILGATEATTSAYYLEDGTVKELSFGHEAYVREGEDVVYCIQSAMDMVYDLAANCATGHTWKEYPFSISEDGSISEYGAREITEKEFLSVNGAEEQLKEIHSEYPGAHLQFLHRGNGWYHVNVGYEETPGSKDGFVDFYYYTFVVQDGVLTLESNSDGCYMKHLLGNEESFVTKVITQIKEQP